jgi:hypothetical protein
MLLLEEAADNAVPFKRGILHLLLSPLGSNAFAERVSEETGPRKRHGGNGNRQRTSRRQHFLGSLFRSARCSASHHLH